MDAMILYMYMREKKNCTIHHLFMTNEMFHYSILTVGFVYTCAELYCGLHRSCTTSSPDIWNECSEGN